MTDSRLTLSISVPDTGQVLPVMSKTTIDVVRGGSRLVFDAVGGVTGIVEAMHADISRLQMPADGARSDRTLGITGLVYRTIHAVNSGLRAGVDASLGPLAHLADKRNPTPAEEVAFAVLNGVIGDHLESTGNPLALDMQLRSHGQTLSLDPANLAAAVPQATDRIVILMHGLCMSDVQWTRNGNSHADRLVSEHGYTALYLRYNSGRHIASNGRDLAQLLDRLVSGWPVPIQNISFVTHSMGGLVARSACHYGAQQAWLSKLRHIVFLATPHHGAPLERGGNTLEIFLGSMPFASALNRLGTARSAGVTDLRFGNLVDEDWDGFDRFEHRADTRRVVPLPAGVNCYIAAATIGVSAGDMKDVLIGDGLVPLESALGEHAEASRVLGVPAERRWVGYGMNHFGLLHDPDLHALVARWLAQAPRNR